MWKSFCRWLLYKQLGWSIDVTQEHPSKYIICLAPHTSNWDFLIGQLYNGAEGLKSNFLMKKEWFFWPLGPIFRSLGGIPVFRSKKTSMTDNLAEAARKAETFMLCITPEGTRSPNPEYSCCASHRRELARRIPNGREVSTILPKRPRFPFCFMALTTSRNSSVAQRPLSPTAILILRCATSNFISRTSKERSPKTLRLVNYKNAKTNPIHIFIIYICSNTCTGSNVKRRSKTGRQFETVFCQI